MIETAITLPLFLLALFGVIYFSRFGVVNERVQLAIRYAGVAAFDSTSASLYSAANIYDDLNLTALPASCPAPPAGILSGGDPFPGPVAASYWTPDGTTATSAACGYVVKSLNGANFLSTHYFAATQPQMATSVSVPGYIKSGIAGLDGSIEASEAFVHAATPGIVLYCNKAVNDRVYAALTATGSAPSATPIPNNASPPPPLQNSPNCDN